jgi:hypothetical protein
MYVIIDNYLFKDEKAKIPYSNEYLILMVKFFN